MVLIKLVKRLVPKQLFYFIKKRMISLINEAKELLGEAKKKNNKPPGTSKGLDASRHPVLVLVFPH